MKKRQWTILLAAALTAASMQGTALAAEYDTEVYVEDVNEDWALAYLEAITEQDTYWQNSYALINVDGDDIPEMVCNTGVEAGGCQVYTWHDGVIDMLQTSRLGYTYIEYGNLFNNCAGHMGAYYDMIYTIEDGMWTAVDSGYHIADLETGTETYTWNEQEVSQEEYEELLRDVYDTDAAQTPEYYYTYNEICSLLSTGETESEGHRYEVVRKDVTWSEAQEECEAKGGYLAALTSQEEFDYVSGLIKEAGCQGCSVWVGGSQKYSTRFGYYWITPEGEYDMISSAFLPFWLAGEPSYTGLTESGTQMDEDSVAMLYIKSDGRFYLNDAPDDILQAAPSYAGHIAYVCEYDY